MVMVAKGPSATRARSTDVDGSPSAARWQFANQPALPDWLTSIHDHQLQAVEDIAKEYARGSRVVFLDAPVGSGKTLVGELTRREMQLSHALYVCSTKSLQQQVARDFDYARVLKGRSNYTPTSLSSRERDGYRQGVRGARALSVSCADCDASPSRVPREDQSCSYCQFVEDCPYLVARDGALRAGLGVLNTSYLLAECNGPGKFRGADLVVADEADLIEGELLGFVELRLSARVVGRLGLEVPKKGSHMATIRGWLAEAVAPGLEAEAKVLRSARDLEGRREHTRVTRMLGDVQRVVAREEGWVRDGDEEGDRSGHGLVLKPVSVQDVGDRFLWQHAERWLCMTGTLVSAEMEAESLGLEEAGIPWGVVEVPMLFDKERRRVVYAPQGLMTRKGQEAGEGAKVLAGVARVLELHPGVNVLVHTHTYKLAREVVAHLEAGGDGRQVFTYGSAWERDGALEKFKARADAGGSVLVAASMDRGVDLPGSLCRVQVIAKVPMASLGSRQVSERLRQPGGQLWYACQTVRSLLQMCGRAVRGMDDQATTYILDAHFGKLLKDGKRLGLFPPWWLSALELGRLKELP